MALTYSFAFSSIADGVAWLVLGCIAPCTCMKLTWPLLQSQQSSVDEKRRKPMVLMGRERSPRDWWRALVFAFGWCWAPASLGSLWEPGGTSSIQSYSHPPCPCFPTSMAIIKWKPSLFCFTCRTRAVLFATQSKSCCRLWQYKQLFLEPGHWTPWEHKKHSGVWSLNTNCLQQMQGGTKKKGSRCCKTVA